MDEPFAALDEQTRLLLGDKVLQIQQELKQTTLLITHNITEAVQLSDRILVMTYRPGKVKRIVDIDLPRPRTSEIVVERGVRPLRRADLERPARGGEPRHAGRRERACCAPATSAMSAAALVRDEPLCPGRARGRLAAWRSSLLVEAADPRRRHQPLHRAAAVARSSPRFRASSSRSTCSSRFLLTAGEALSASVLVTRRSASRGGVLLHRYRLLRLATETWVAAIAAAPLVLMYPLYPRDLRPQRHHHRDDGLRRRAARRSSSRRSKACPARGAC